MPEIEVDYNDESELMKELDMINKSRYMNAAIFVVPGLIQFLSFLMLLYFEPEDRLRGLIHFFLFGSYDL